MLVVKLVHALARLASRAPADESSALPFLLVPQRNVRARAPARSLNMTVANKFPPNAWATEIMTARGFHVQLRAPRVPSRKRKSISLLATARFIGVLKLATLLADCSPAFRPIHYCQLDRDNFLFPCFHITRHYFYPARIRFISLTCECSL